MFAYNPTENDQSGRIIAQGMMGAAQTNAQMMGQLGQDIGGALAGIGQMYGEIEGRKAKGRAFKDVFKVVSPSMGISMEQLEAVSGGKLKNDMDWYNVSETISPLMPSMINAQLVKGNMGIKQDQQQLTRDMPMAKATTDALSDVAAGQAPYTPTSRQRGVIPAATQRPIISTNPVSAGAAALRGYGGTGLYNNQ